MRRLLGSAVEVWADVHEATSLALASTPAWAATEAHAFGRADVLVVTGTAVVADALARSPNCAPSKPDVPFVVGGRVSLDTIDDTVAAADGAILGSAIKRSSAADARVDAEVAARFGRAWPPAPDRAASRRASAFPVRRLPRGAGPTTRRPTHHLHRLDRRPHDARTAQTATRRAPSSDRTAPSTKRQQAVVARVSAAEHASIVALPTDHRSTRSAGRGTRPRSRKWSRSPTGSARPST